MPEKDLPKASEVPPEFSSLEEAAAWYDTHDTSELPGETVDVEPAPVPTVSRSVRFDLDTMGRLRRVAVDRGVEVTQLMRQWIEERLAEEEKEAASPGSSRSAARTPR